jgi:hypothetical protein
VSASLDIFDLLDVSRREDSYSSVLQQLLLHSPRLRQRMLARAFPRSTPALLDPIVKFRSALPHGSGVPDLLVVGEDASGQRWELFIENKIDARESPGQTQAYFDACNRRAVDRAAGIFLTLDGHPPNACKQVVALTHAEVGEWVKESLHELSDPVLRMAADTYVRRACAEPPQAALGEIVESLLKQPTGLLPRNAGTAALGHAIVAAAPGWSHTPIWIQGRGHGNLGLQFHRDGWRGTQINGIVFERGNHNIHAEIEFGENDGWSLKLHFETEPYLTGRQLERLEGIAEFGTMRDAFRKAIHQRRVDLSGWKMTNYPLQICAFETELSSKSRVGDMVEVLARALTSIGPVADAALLSAKG